MTSNSRSPIVELTLATGLLLLRSSALPAAALARALAARPRSLHRTCAGISASVGSTVGQEFDGEFGIDTIDSVILIRLIRWFTWAFTYRLPRASATPTHRPPHIIFFRAALGRAGFEPKCPLQPGEASTRFTMMHILKSIEEFAEVNGKFKSS